MFVGFQKATKDIPLRKPACLHATKEKYHTMANEWKKCRWEIPPSLPAPLYVLEAIFTEAK